MLESIFASTNYQASKALLDIAARRHEVLAGNLANVDTPGYRRLDIDPSFRARLEESIRTGDSRELRALGQVGITPEAGLKATRAGGNNVSVERELMLVNQNALEYQSMAQFVSSSLSRLKMAITGQTQ